MTEVSPVDYASEVASVTRSLQAFQEPILVLFTSKEMLLAVSDLLDQPHLAQYKKWGTKPTEKRFEKANGRSCLEQVVSGKGLIFQPILV